jgi:hypothetical protein
MTTDPDDNLSERLLAIIDQAPPIDADDVLVQARLRGRTAATARGRLRPGRAIARSKVLLRVAAIVCLAGGLAAIVALRVSSTRRVGTPRPATQPLPELVKGALVGDSCLSPTFCVAVGAQGAKSTSTLIEEWNGTRWSPVASPTPRGASSVYLSSISCTSTTSCVAIGSEELQRQRTLPFGESWDGVSWHLDGVPVAGVEPGQGVFVEVSGLSCTLSGYCMAVGYYAGTGQPDRQPAGTFADQWVDGRWTPQAAPAVVPVLSVSCVSSSWCVASVTPNSGSQADIERWNGLRWSSTSGGLGQANYVASASCVSAVACVVAEATSGDRVEAVDWNGGHWIAEDVPGLRAGYQAVGVDLSCATTASCLIVGTGLRMSNAAHGESSTTLFAAQWDGRRWRAIPAPVSTGDAKVLQGLSCAAANYCMTAGTVGDLWDGTTWRTTFLSASSVATAGQSPDNSNAELGG